MTKFVCLLLGAAALAFLALPAESAGTGALVLNLAAAMLAPVAAKARDGRAGHGEDADGWSAWQVLPLEGTYELVYRDEAGRFSIRVLDAQELKIGPGKTLLGGFCEARGGYRGFRADRIERIADAETGEAAERNVIDWLLKRAAKQARRRAAEDAVGLREARHGA